MSFSRKLKRKKQSEFFKKFKKTMSHFKKMVKCVSCSRLPQEGEHIDNWQVQTRDEKISLFCPTCVEEGNNNVQE